jgi:hypothetical protein
MSTNPQPEPVPGRLEAAADHGIAVCGGDTRDAVKALIVANEFLEARVEQLKADVSSGTRAAATTEDLRPAPDDEALRGEFK